MKFSKEAFKLPSISTNKGKHLLKIISMTLGWEEDRVTSLSDKE